MSANLKVDPSGGLVVRCKKSTPKGQQALQGLRGWGSKMESKGFLRKRNTIKEWFVYYMIEFPSTPAPCLRGACGPGGRQRQRRGRRLIIWAKLPDGKLQETPRGGTPEKVGR
eukprot:UC4_evm1s315